MSAIGIRSVKLIHEELNQTKTRDHNKEYAIPLFKAEHSRHHSSHLAFRSCVGSSPSPIATSRMTLFILLFLPSSREAEMFALGRVRPPGSVLPPRRSSEGSGVGWSGVK